MSTHVPDLAQSTPGSIVILIHEVVRYLLPQIKLKKPLL